MVSLLISTLVITCIAIATQMGHFDNLFKLINLLMGREVEQGEQALSTVMIPIRVMDVDRLRR